MVDVVNYVCEFNGCLKQPVLNIKGEKKGRFCKTHKETEMVNVVDNVC